MPGEEREELEREIRHLLASGDHEGAATRAIRGYGAEIFGFLHAFHRDEEDAAEVFSCFSERLWRALPTFQGDSSFRTWVYTLARHASLNYRRDLRRRELRQQPLPEDSARSALVARIRSETVSYLRSERQARFAGLRESLPSEDQALLILRVDRGLAWNELARVLNDSGQPLGEPELKREAARLRKRFQLLKERLLELGRRAGVVSDEGGGA
ncbi:RNA polymerase sigma factor [Archangium lansingense]|uniref:Sigma-70 family RNA polymerase sigma factor n=1 Tax=Archangium lansingense TaxID=2995310 RepID=A0ABT4A7W9_9BACT|nr:sigma-70 family RNA polymerase sigma factor [Archangium lansinium]MCY1077049.1 sigma-70 family RNA polymerase sigma factor [Archangium lansinium]